MAKRTRKMPVKVSDKAKDAPRSPRKAVKRTRKRAERPESPFGDESGINWQAVAFHHDCMDELAKDLAEAEEAWPDADREEQINDILQAMNEHQEMMRWFVRTDGAVDSEIEADEDGGFRLTPIRHWQIHRWQEEARRQREQELEDARKEAERQEAERRRAEKEAQLAAEREQRRKRELRERRQQKMCDLAKLVPAYVNVLPHYVRIVDVDSGDSTNSICITSRWYLWDASKTTDFDKEQAGDWVVAYADHNDSVEIWNGTADIRRLSRDRHFAGAYDFKEDVMKVKARLVAEHLDFDPETENISWPTETTTAIFCHVVGDALRKIEAGEIPTGDKNPDYHNAWEPGT